MKKPNYPCPCGGFVKWKIENVVRDGVDCGMLDTEVCGKCGEVYLPENSMRIVVGILKAVGSWSAERREVKLWMSGNSARPFDITGNFRLCVPHSAVLQNPEQKGYGPAYPAGCPAYNNNFKCLPNRTCHASNPSFFRAASHG